MGSRACAKNEMESPAEIESFSSNLITAVLTSTGQRLDMTPETLPFLDYYGRIFRESREKKSAKDKDKDKDNGKDISLLFAPMAGAYFGQVICKKYECEWFAPHRKYDRWRIQFSSCFLFFNPVAVAIEVLNQRELEGWSSSYIARKEDEEWICTIFDQWDMVIKEDYFSFSVRWEILDTIIDKLKTAELMERGGKWKEKVRTYGNTDYEKYIKGSLKNKFPV